MSPVSLTGWKNGASTMVRVSGCMRDGVAVEGVVHQEHAQVGAGTDEARVELDRDHQAEGAQQHGVAGQRGEHRVEVGRGSLAGGVATYAGSGCGYWAASGSRASGRS